MRPFAMQRKRLGVLKCSVASALLLGLFGLSGCSKTLTESSAVGIVQKYVDAHTEAERLKFGHLVVDRCGGLLLEMETMATANCELHVELTKAGEARVAASNRLLSVTTEIEQASFGKKPDGTWVCTELSGALVYWWM